MAMAAGGGQGKVELNVTPLIDVLLVLLIIFMVIMPSLSNGLKTVAPLRKKGPRVVSRFCGTVVNQEPVVGAGGGYLFEAFGGV